MKFRGKTHSLYFFYIVRVRKKDLKKLMEMALSLQTYREKAVLPLSFIYRNCVVKKLTERERERVNQVNLFTLRHGSLSPACLPA